VPAEKPIEAATTRRTSDSGRAARASRTADAERINSKICEEPSRLRIPPLVAKDPAPELKGDCSRKPEISPQKADETTPPDFLFEDDKPAEAKPAPKEEAKPKPAPAPQPAPAPKSEPGEGFSRPTTSINIANILKPAIATIGMEFELPDDEIVKIMVLANKSERTALAGKWHHFADLKADPKIGALASLLSDGHPFCICKEAIILSYNFTKRKKEANIMANQQSLEELLKEVIQRDVFVYAIDRIDANRLTAAFFNLQQINKLPKKEEVKLNLPIGGNKS
jgi:hypothetical protein